jgi:hypothetical protein
VLRFRILRAEEFHGVVGTPAACAVAMAATASYHTARAATMPNRDTGDFEFGIRAGGTLGCARNELARQT